jgi:hypothetical protein
MPYEIAQLNDDDTPSAVRFGFTSSENSAAHIAIATANKRKIDTCVVHVWKDNERIVQRIRYRNDTVLAVPADAPPRMERRYYGPVSITFMDTLAFMQECVANGYTLTVTPAQPDPVSGIPSAAQGYVNIVAIPPKQ